MINKMARAIHSVTEREVYSDFEWGTASKGLMQPYLDEARAAIAAMLNKRSFMDRPDTGKRFYAFDIAEIDAALNE